MHAHRLQGILAWELMQAGEGLRSHRGPRGVSRGWRSDLTGSEICPKLFPAIPALFRHSPHTPGMPLAASGELRGGRSSRYDTHPTMKAWPAGSQPWRYHASFPLRR